MAVQGGKGKAVRPWGSSGAGKTQPRRAGMAACPAETPRARLACTPDITESPPLAPPLIAVLNGPNINMLGMREPEKYGSTTIDELEQLCADAAEELGLAIDFRQTNSEGELVTWVQECRGRCAGIIMNPAGYTTNSIATMDALLAVNLPTIEVHITNIHRREEFRHHSFISKAATGVIAGLGVEGYVLALRAMAGLVDAEQDA